MQQNSPVYFFRMPGSNPVIQMARAAAAKSRQLLLASLVVLQLVLGSAVCAHAQVADSTAHKEKPVADSLLRRGDNRPSPLAPAAVGAPPPSTVVQDSSGAQLQSQAQPDSTLREAMKPFSLRLPGTKQHTPKGATIRSLILPGWGQAYNHEYWKVPLAVAAVGIPIYLYFDNSREYNSARRAYSVVFEEMPVVSGGKGKLDPAKFAQIDQKFQDAYNRYKKVGGNYVTNFLSTVQNYRNTFRQYRDYSIVAAVLGWGLQIADATVFGHLHGFDVSDDISLNIRPVYFPYARIPGIALHLTF